MAKSFDFTSVEAAAELSYLKPGVYEMKITDVKLGKYEQKGTPYLGIEFTTVEDGLKFTEKMTYSSEEATKVFMSRLQYLHEAWSGAKLNKVFKSIDEIEAYFKKAFVNPKAGKRRILIGGEQNGNKVYARLPFTNFIVGEDSDLENGEFEEGSPLYKQYVVASKLKSSAAGKKNGILNDDSNDVQEDDNAGSDKDTPW